MLAGRDRVLDGEIDADAANRRHCVMSGIADAQQSRPTDRKALRCFATTTDASSSLFSLLSSLAAGFEISLSVGLTPIGKHMITALRVAKVC
jgi:hypothetical protein